MNETETLGSEASGRRRPGPAAIAAVAVAAIGIYAGSFGNGFVGDDRYLVVENPSLDPASPWSALLTEPWGARADTGFDRRMNAAYYRPATMSLLRAQRALWGTAPAGYHAVSALLHALASILLLLIASRWLAPAGACAAGLLFALHAVHTEAVCAAFYSTTLLASVFSLAALWIHSAPPPRSGRPGPRRAAVAALYALAVLSKESAVVLPIVLALHDLVLRRTGIRGLRDPLWAVLAIVAAAYAFARIGALPPGGGFSYFEGVGAASKWLTMAGVFGLYLRLLAWPLPLCPFYEWSIVPPVEGFSLSAAVGVVAVAAYLAASIRLSAGAPRRATGDLPPRRHVAAFAMWILPATLLPVSHAVPILNVAAERFLYLGSATACLLFGLAAERLLGLGRAIRVASAAVLGLYLVAHGAMTANRTTEWRDDETLARATLRDFPSSLSARLALGRALLDRGDCGEAMSVARDAVGIAPGVAAPRALEEEARFCLSRGGASTAPDP